MDSKAAMSDLEDDEEMNLGWFSLVSLIFDRQT